MYEYDNEKYHYKYMVNEYILYLSCHNEMAQGPCSNNFKQHRLQ